MKRVNMILQGKGGVGKSLIASLLAQHFIENGASPICIDTDPVNATFAGYKEYAARRLQLVRNDDLDPRAFDELAEAVAKEPKDAVFVIDNGSATFVPLCAWMLENNALQFFKSVGAEVFLHSVVTGGQAMADTQAGLASLLGHFEDQRAVIWLNEYFGPLGRNGVAFEDSTLFKEHENQIHAIIKMPALRKETFGADLNEVLQAKLSFKSALADERFSIMARQRLAMVWRDFEKQMAGANL